MSESSKWSNLYRKLKSADRKKRILLIGSGVVLVILCGIGLVLVSGNRKEQVVYKESIAQTGLLNHGVSETGSVDVGTVTQSFDLDISEFTGESSMEFNTSGGGQMFGMEMMTGNQMGNAGQSSSARTLEIEEVYVEAGEEIAKGSPLLKLTQESVDSIRNELSEDVTNAQLVYEQAVTVKKQTAVSAESEYQTNVLYGTYGQAEYDAAVKEQQELVEKKQEELAELEEALADAQETLSMKQELFTEQKQVLSNAEYMETYTDEEENLYWWIVAWQTRADADAMVETLEEEIEELTDSIAQYEEQIQTADTALLLSQKELESEQIRAEGQRELRSFYAEHAQEIYNIAVEQSDFDTTQAQADYEEAKEKLQEFDATIVEQVIDADEGGLVMDVYVAAGDTLTQNMEIINMNDYDAVTITVSVEEDDMDLAAVGNAVNVTVAAFPDEVFHGEVTEIGDAEIDSNTNKTWCSVTVTVQNTGDILYQDMTAEVTFLSDESADVLYVPSRAVLHDGEKNYVLVKGKDGKKEKREVGIGISDGVNTEIKEGLSEGEVVFVESRGKQS